MNTIEHYKEMLEVNPKWLGTQAREMLAHYTELEVKLEASERENRILRINSSRSVLRRLVIQEAIRPFGNCPKHGQSIHPEESECPICGKELVDDDWNAISEDLLSDAPGG